MKAVSEQVLSALQARAVVPRWFLWIAAVDLVTRDPAPAGLWNDVGTLSVDVVTLGDEGVVTRAYVGSGTLVSLSEIRGVSDLTSHSVTLTLSGVDQRVINLVRGYDIRQAAVEVHLGLLDPQTRLLVAPAELSFAGFVDEASINEPTPGSSGSIDLVCASHSRELTRANPDTRSDASQRLRNPADAFYRDTAVVSDWELVWGRNSSKAGTGAKRR